MIRRKSVVSTGKKNRQNHHRATILIRPMTVITDASDVKRRPIGKNDPIKLCACLTEKSLTTAFKSKIIRFKMDENPLQLRIYFLTFVESLEVIYSQYKENCEVLLDYAKIEGDGIEDYAKKAIRNILHENIYVHSRILIAELSIDGTKCIEKLQSHCANMNFSDKGRYERTFQQVTHKGGEYAMDYIKRLQNAHALSISVGNSYSEYQWMHKFLYNLYIGGKYPAQIASHQAELRREEKCTDQKSLNISFLQTDYQNLDSSSGFGRNSEIAKTVQTKCTFCGGTNYSAEKCFKMIRQEKKKARAAGHSDNRQTEHTPQHCFRCGFEEQLIAKSPDSPKENEKRRKQVCLMKKLIMNATIEK